MSKPGSLDGAAAGGDCEPGDGCADGRGARETSVVTPDGEALDDTARLEVTAAGGDCAAGVPVTVT
jgi:hypothetical protein